MSLLLKKKRKHSAWVKKYTREREQYGECNRNETKDHTVLYMWLLSCFRILSSFYCRKVGEERGKEEVRNDKKKKREKGKDEKRKKWNG